MRLNINPFKRNDLDKTIAQVKQIYAQIDRQIAVFKKSTGVNCKHNCGHCCENPHVYATVIEMFPIAEYLWKSGKAERIIEQINNTPAQSRCIFYQPDLSVPGNGKCTIYPYRASLCRLFGFSAKRDKHNNPMLVTCSVIKKLYPHEVENLKSAKNKIAIPSMGEWSRKLSCIDPYRGTDQVHINHAIKVALEKTGLKLQLRQYNSPRTHFATIYNRLKYGTIRAIKNIQTALFGRFRIKRGF